MALPLLVPAVVGGGSYVYGKFFSDDGKPVSTGASVVKVAIAGLAIYGAIQAYKGLKR